MTTTSSAKYRRNRKPVSPPYGCLARIAFYEEEGGGGGEAELVSRCHGHGRGLPAIALAAGRLHHRLLAGKTVHEHRAVTGIASFYPPRARIVAPEARMAGGHIGADFAYGPFR